MSYLKQIVSLLTETSEASISSLGWRRDLYPLFFVGLFSALLMVPLMVYGIPNGGDLLNHFRHVLPFYDQIRGGDLYPGWLAESNNGLGDPRFRFYPPGLYYLMAFVRMVSGNWYVGVIGSIVILHVVGGVGAYLWSRNFLESRTAAFAALFYSAAPFRLNEVYQAAMLAEYAACSVLPFSFFFADRVCRKRQLSDVFGLAISYSLLVLCNLPLAVIGSLSLMAYCLLRLERTQVVATLMRLASSVLLGLALSAFFWSTMIAELTWIKGNSIQQNQYYNYRLNFLYSPAALTNRNTWYANFMGLAIVAFVLPALVLVFRFFKQRSPLKAAFILCVGSFLMATPLSRPVWAIVPKLSEVQFPWRWLAITSLASAPLIAASLTWWRVQITKWRPRDLAVTLAFALSLLFISYEVIYDGEFYNKERIDKLVVDCRGAVSFKDWLPIWAKELLQVEKMSDRLKSESRQASISSWEPEHRTINIAGGNEEEIQLRTYYYPLWRATLNGKALQTFPSPDGLLRIKTPSESGTIDVVFTEPRRVVIASVISAASWIVAVALLFLGTWRSSRRSTRRPQQEEEQRSYFAPLSVSSRLGFK